MFVLDISTSNLDASSNLSFGRIRPNHLPEVNNPSTTLPALIDSFTPFQSHDLLHRVPIHELDPTLRKILYPGRSGSIDIDPGFFHPVFPPGAIDIDPGFNPINPFPIAPNPWESLFPRPAPPSNEEMIKGLDRIDSLIDFVKNSTEINGVNPRMLNKAHKVIKEK